MFCDECHQFVTGFRWRFKTKRVCRSCIFTLGNVKLCNLCNRNPYVNELGMCFRCASAEIRGTEVETIF